MQRFIGFALGSLESEFQRFFCRELSSYFSQGVIPISTALLAKKMYWVFNNIEYIKNEFCSKNHSAAQKYLAVLKFLLYFTDPEIKSSERSTAIVPVEAENKVQNAISFVKQIKNNNEPQEVFYSAAQVEQMFLMASKLQAKKSDTLMSISRKRSQSIPRSIRGGHSFNVYDNYFKLEGGFSICKSAINLAFVSLMILIISFVAIYFNIGLSNNLFTGQYSMPEKLKLLFIEHKMRVFEIIKESKEYFLLFCEWAYSETLKILTGAFNKVSSGAGNYIESLLEGHGISLQDIKTFVRENWQFLTGIVVALTKQGTATIKDSSEKKDEPTESFSKKLFKQLTSFKEINEGRKASKALYILDDVNTWLKNNPLQKEIALQGVGLIKTASFYIFYAIAWVLWFLLLAVGRGAISVTKQSAAFLYCLLNVLGSTVRKTLGLDLEATMKILYKLCKSNRSPIGSPLGSPKTSPFKSPISAKTSPKMSPKDSEFSGILNNNDFEELQKIINHAKYSIKETKTSIENATSAIKSPSKSPKVVSPRTFSPKSIFQEESPTSKLKTRMSALTYLR